MRPLTTISATAGQDPATPQPAVERQAASRPAPAMASGDDRLLSSLSVAMMTAIAALPIVIAVGFLTDRWSPADGVHEVSSTTLRGPLDAEGAEVRVTAANRSGPQIRAGY